MANMTSMLGLTPEEMEIARKLKYAEALRQKSEQEPQAQMISGHYIAPSWTQGLANVLSAYGASKADQDASDMQKRYRQKQADALRGIMAQGNVPAVEGRPEQWKVGGNTFNSQQEADAYSANTDNSAALASALSSEPLLASQQQMTGGNGEYTMPTLTATAPPSYAPVEHIPGQVAKPGGFDFSRVMAAAIQDPENPLFAQAIQHYASMQPDKAEWVIGERYNDKTGMKEKVMYNKANPMQMMPFGGQEAVKKENWDGIAVNPYELPSGTVMPNPNKPFNPDGSPNKAYQEYETNRARAGAPTTNQITNVNAFEPFKNKVQGEMGSGLVKSYETLQNIPQTLKALDAAKQYASKAGNFTGSGADTKLAVAKFFNNNLGTNIDPEGVKNVEALKSALFYNVMDNLKKMDASPSQQQQQIMQEAFGRINTDPNALPMIIDFYKGQLESKAAEHNRRVDQTMTGPAGMQFPYDIHVRVPEAANPQKPAAPQAFSLPPNAKQFEGKILRDTQTGKRFQSKGGKWVEVR